MTSDEIKDAIAAGTIGAIALDTSIFDGNGLRLESGLLQRMVQFRGTAVQFVLSEIVVSEVLAHVRKAAADSHAQLETACKALEKSWLIPKGKIEGVVDGLFEGESAAEFAKKRVEKFIEVMGCQIVYAADHVDVKDLLGRYFSPAAPFSVKESKKSEFPDAFALLSLESWAKKSGKKLLVVSKDGDWVRYCSASEFLVQVDDLGGALSLFHRDASVACNVLALGIQNEAYPHLKDWIESALERHIDGMDFIVDADSAYYYEYELDDWTIDEITLGGMDGEVPRVEPIDSGDDYLVVKIPVCVEMTVSHSFQFSVRDSIDRDYISIGSCTSRVHPQLNLDVLITLDREFDADISIDDIEVLGKRRLALAYGEVEPYWNEDPHSDFY